MHPSPQEPEIRVVNRNRDGILVRSLLCCVVLVALLGACELQPPPGGSLPDISLPEVTTPDLTLPEVTTPDSTEPEATTPEETAPEVTEPEVTEPEATTPNSTEPSEAAAPPEEGETSPWLWIVLAGLVIALLVGALAARGRARSAEASWKERARSALLGVAAIEATLGRPATLDPSDHEAMRRSVASARDQSVSFEQLAASASDQALAQQAAAVSDALRVLATSSEIEVEGLASGALNTVANREAAESDRRVHLQTLRQAADRLSQKVQ
ncbi:MAG TPA: hypothetical protein VI193_03550 [Acidimicrobiia bacterium]